MMNVSQLLVELRQRDVRLWVDEDKLRFDAPKGVFTNELKEALRAQKLQVMATLRSLEGDAQLPPVEAYPRDESPRLSHQQERLWFLDRLVVDSRAYNIPAFLRLQGALSIPRLEAAFEIIQERHESLRSVFPEVDGRPRLQILPSGPFRLPVVNLSKLPEGLRLAEAQHITRTEAQRPFDLSQGPLMRVLVLRLAADETLLVMNMHHIISDRWSTGVLLAELAALDRALLDGVADPRSVLPPLPLQYRDYAQWQKEVADHPRMRAQLDYWCNLLAGDLPLLELPSAKVRSAAVRFRGRTFHFELSSEVSRGAKRLAQREGTTLFVLLLTVFKVLLYRYSGQRDLIVGTPIANRNESAFEPLIGFFANTLVLRSAIEGERTFLDLLSAVKRRTLEAFHHQDIAFERVVEAINPERDLRHNPVFQVAFVLNTDEVPTLRLGEATLEPVVLETESAKFDLLLALQEEPRGLSGFFEYDIDLFYDDAIETLQIHFAALLESILERPSSRLDALSMLTAEERQQILHTWNDTDRHYRSNLCIHQLFEIQARQYPRRVAALCGEETITYGALNRRANRIAHFLIGQGVRHGEMVAVCFRRSLDMIAGLLGVLKAGGAYVPLDPAYPTQRVENILQRTGARLLLTQTGVRDEPLAVEVEVVLLDQRSFDGLAEDDPAVGITSDDLAYVIFTSGSTGMPKGVIVQHRPVINLIEWVNESFQVGRTDRLLFITSLCFDLSVYDIFGILAAGGEVYIATEEELEDPALLARVLVENGITFWDSAPAALQRLTPFFYPDRGADSALRLVFNSGDWVPLSLPPTIDSTFPGCQFVALGGATEATIWSNFFVVGRIEEGWKSVPYGMPIQNATYYTLDDHLGLCPVGIPGDLYIGSRCLSFGYFGQPALTAERYVPDPFTDQPGGVLYRTGDRAMRWADGNLEFLGRLDEQVKIRGFRIELGEIEAVLRKHPEVLEAKALARDFAQGDKRLVAYVQIHRPDRLDEGDEDAAVEGKAHDDLVDDLEGWTRDSLPEYMVPSAFVFLYQWPVTANGKLDRKALPEPQVSSTDGPSREPSTPTEIALAAIWRELLNLEALAADDNFFDLGGHSLLATQVVSLVRTEMEVELPLAELFAHPTVATLGARLDDMVGEVSHLSPLLVHVDRSGHLPLSFSQERMLFLNRLEPDSGAYNIPAALRLRGPLDHRALEAALAKIVERQEGLRTDFHLLESSPTQRVHEVCEVPLPVVDLTDRPVEERERAALELAEEDAGRPFRLDQAPLFRTTLIRLADAEHIILLNMNHIISDGWSTGVMLREFVHFYNGLVDGESEPLVPLPVQYADYSVWQRRRLEAGALDGQLDYWKQQLQGMPPALELPTDRPREGAFRFRGGAYRWPFPEGLIDRIRGLMKVEDATLFILLLSAFTVLLERYSGQKDVVVGSPVANRNREETEPLIGFFVNTLVLRGDLRGNPSFVELLGRMKRMAVAAYDHQDLPFEKLVETINPDRDLSRNPLFQIVFMVQNSLAPTVPMRGLEIEVVPVENHTAKFDLTMDLEEHPDRLMGRVEFNADTFDASTIQRMMDHYVNLLEDIVRRPSRRIDALQILSPSERLQVVSEWNDTAATLAADVTLHELFQAQAQATPDAVAARLGGETITYAAIGRHANRVTHRLTAHGIERGDLVAVCLPRCLEIPAALLGVMQSGAAYVPLDPAYPEERMRYILERVGAKVLVTHSRIAGRLADLPAEVWAVDDAVFAEQSDARVARRCGGADLAYIIFTSGSTGTPKGVVLQHRPVVNLIDWVNTTYGVGPGDRLLFVTSLCFDLSVYDVFGTLAAGATIEIAQDDDLGDPERLTTLLCSGVTFWDSAPAALQQLVPLLPEEGGTDLRLVFLSGDWVPLSLPPAISQTFPKAQVVALGGATEAAIWSNSFPVHGIEPHWRSVPYGRPIKNAHYHVLDSRLEPCPIGVPGDLYIGRDCLSLHYFGQPALSAERYVPDPFSERGGDVLYTTGDRARWLPDGNLEFLGRLDHQVKIRGFRIELGEIEAVLRKVPSVEEAVVLAREDRPGDKQLAAYVELRAGAGTPEDEEVGLRQFLRHHLPEYMMPPHIFFLEQWPVTSNGKLDRKALPAPSDERTASRDPAAGAPRSPVEEGLAGLWADLLGLPEIGIHDDFFALGGHSILIAQMVGRLRETFGIDIPIRQLFELPTVALLAEVVEKARHETTAGDSTSMERWTDLQRVPLSYAQERLWLQYSMRPDSSAYNVPVAVRLKGRLREHSLHRALAEVVRRHDGLRAVFRSEEEGALAAITDNADLPWEVVDLSAYGAETLEQEMHQRAEAEAAVPFDLETGPVIRALLLRLRAQEHVLVITIHHIVFDGLSVGVLIRELTSLYEAFAEGRAPELEPLAFQYGDFAAWQRRVLAGEDLEKHLDYWAQTLAGAPPYLELPSAKTRPEVMTERGGTEPFRLEAEETAALVALGHHHGCTPFMVLLAAFDAVIYHHTRSEDVVVGTDAGGRPHAAMEPMIGFFVNQLALRTSLAGNPTFTEILQRVRRTTLEAYNHQEAPFHKVVERLNPPRDRSRTPVVQLKLVYQDNPGGRLRLGDLALSEVLLGGQAVKFDVWLNIWPESDGLSGRLEYNRDVLTRAEVEQFLRQLTTLLGKVAFAPEIDLADLDRIVGAVASTDQRRRLKKIGKSLFQRRQRPPRVKA